MITFTQGGQLRFVDPRTFGEMFVTASDTVEQDVSELSHLGLDPIECHVETLLRPMTKHLGHPFVAMLVQEDLGPAAVGYDNPGAAGFVFHDVLRFR